MFLVPVTPAAAEITRNVGGEVILSTITAAMVTATGPGPCVFTDGVLFYRFWVDREGYLVREIAHWIEI